MQNNYLKVFVTELLNIDDLVCIQCLTAGGLFLAHVIVYIYIYMCVGGVFNFYFLLELK